MEHDTGQGHTYTHMLQRSHGLCQSLAEYGNTKCNPASIKSVRVFGVLQWNTTQKNSLEDLASSSCQASPPPSSSLSTGWGGGLGTAAPILAASSDAKSPPLFGRACQARSKHTKASKESYLLGGEKHNMEILGVIRFIKLQNDT